MVNLNARQTNIRSVILRLGWMLSDDDLLVNFASRNVIARISGGRSLMVVPPFEESCIVTFIYVAPVLRVAG